jgi:hypothetical protein
VLVAAFAPTMGAYGPVIAKEAAPPADGEEQVDEGLKGFGYLTGLALGCVTPEQRTMLEREAARELRRCTTRECARREMREGYREVNRERREARCEIRREVREARNERYWRDQGRYYDDDDSSKVLGGVIVGAAVVGVAAAIANANDDDDLLKARSAAAGFMPRWFAACGV